MNQRATDHTSAELARRVSILERRLDGIDVDRLQRASDAHEKAIGSMETALATLRGRVEAHLAPESQSPMRAARPIDAGTITLHGDPPSKGDQPHDRVVPRAGLISLAERAEMLLRGDEAHGTGIIVSAEQVPAALRLHANSVEGALEEPSSDDLRNIAASLVRLALFLDAQSGE